MITVQEHDWSLHHRLVSSFWEEDQQKDLSLQLKLSALTIAQFPRFLRHVTILDPSSPPPSRHSWLYVGGGGWENQPPQIA